MKPTLSQTPAPGVRRLQFRGDRLRFTLVVQPPLPGRAFVRTNLGHAAVTRREIIAQVERDETPLGHDWYDLPMQPAGPGRFEYCIGLDEVGHFEAKCLFIPEESTEPLWPSGENTAVNVEPADSVCGNITYNAFVRQFGPYKALPEVAAVHEQSPVRKLEGDGYAVIPPSGTFRDLIDHLDFIMHELGCRVLQLLPIHPTPTTYARMGSYGSPYAALSFTAVDPALAVFDPRATPLDQFLELVDAVHAREGRILIDIAINHTGWAASLHETHPQWLARKPSGEIENPGAWGIVWEDLTRLDFRHRGLWTYMADVFLTWCRRGVDGFRCDAGYMIPVPTWRYIIAKVREQFPDTIFLLEGLGGKIEVTRELLNKANFDWAYSELFQNYDRGQIESYLPGANAIAFTDGLTVHFAETHDNNRLASVSTDYARMRTALSALLAPCGAFAFANGVEWFATQKINVHQPCALNWGATPNQVAEIAHLNRLLKTHPAFGTPVELELVSRGEGNFIAFLRRHRRSGHRLMVLANLSGAEAAIAGWPQEKMPLQDRGRDLLGGGEALIREVGGVLQTALAPYQVLCLAEPDDPWPRRTAADSAGDPAAVTEQRLKAKVLELLRALSIEQPPAIDAAVDGLRADPGTFCSRLDPERPGPRVVCWSYPVDVRRQVMLPPGHALLLRAESPFRVRVRDRDRVLTVERSLTDAAGKPFILLVPLHPPEGHCFRELDLTVYTPSGTRHDSARLLCLAPGEKACVRRVFSRNDFLYTPLLALGTNGRGAMLRVAADWQRPASRYDALLAANLNPDYPEDRQILLTRCRAWVVYQGFSISVNGDCLERFAFDYAEGAFWRYRIPTGQGQHILLQVALQMAADLPNCVRLAVTRLDASPAADRLADDHAVTLIVRPDVEDRNFHHTTKAFTGPEHQFPAAVRCLADGFVFAPYGHQLSVRADHGHFTREPEWHYMVHRPVEASRGLDPDSDLFSPGYFSCSLRGGQRVTLTARAVQDGETADDLLKSPPANGMPECGTIPFETALAAALDQFVVRRGEFRTVIAGYPWFLDWGRDTLIVARGLIAAGRLETVKAILIQFARFERQGTVPNMIRGSDASNRDTSDAPLWLFTACADLCAAEGRSDFLERDCGGRTLRQVLIDLAGALIAGTPNGIVMDPDSGLLFSPAHFSWMDTNHPAGSPRQGYPIEIQALWFAALKYLASIDARGRSRWETLAARVAESIARLFWQPDTGYLVDCRHAAPGQSARAAQPDDALRPNQLLAITLGAVSDPVVMRSVLHASQSLLVPGAIRSLADRPVRVPLAVQHNGRLLNTPSTPYQGIYAGDEDTQRKPAYHNGTAWTWLFPSFCEGWVRCYGASERETALSWLSSATLLINAHCVGQLPEIVDGDAPHAQRGCDAQAWGVSELLRVWSLLRRS